MRQPLNFKKSMTNRINTIRYDVLYVLMLLITLANFTLSQFKTRAQKTNGTPHGGAQLNELPVPD